MNKDIRSAFKDALILVVITLVSGLLLGLVNMLTEEPIRLQKEQAVVDSCKAVFPAGDYPSYELSFVLTDYRPSEALQSELLKNGVTVGNIYAAVSPGGMTEGFAIEVTSSEGYGGDIRLMCGVDTYGTLKGVSILEISETAGLGMRAESVLVPQLRNLNVDHITFTKVGKQAENEIDAISGATVTTTAVVNAVNASLDVFAEIAGKEAQHE